VGAERKLILKSFCCEDEKELLTGFAEMVNKWNAGPQKFLCAHNGREFDFPYLCRRMIIHGIPLPSLLQQAGKKPWEVCYIDTMDLWKFGDFKSYTSLNLLAATLGIQTPKDDIDGSMVNSVYWIEKDLDRIVEYCQKDVLTLAQVLLRFHCQPLIKSGNIDIKSVRKADI